MTTRIFSLAVALIFFQFNAFSIGVYQPGDELFVHAGSGLLLRKTPTQKGERILTLNASDAVTVLKTNFKKKPFSVVDFKGYRIRGFWVRVRTADGKEGYVFDGYLSKYRAPITIVDDSGSAYSTAEFYLLANAEKQGERVVLPKGPNRYEHYKQLFKNGAAAEIDHGEGGSAQKIIFQKGITLEEGYLIGKALWLKDMKLKSAISKGKITVTSEDEAYQIEVSSLNGYTVLNMFIAD